MAFFRYAQGMAQRSMELTTLGHRIRHYRQAAGLTLDELGSAVGVAGSHLSLIENGKREPKLSLLQSISRVRTLIFPNCCRQNRPIGVPPLKSS